jgi:hypothetical protein
MNTIILIFIVGILFVFMTSIGAASKRKAAQKPDVNKSTPNGLKRLQTILGLITFGSFVAYYFLQADYFLWISIGLIVVSNLIGAAAKISATANRATKPSPAVNEQPELSGPLPPPSPTFQSNDPYPQTKSIPVSKEFSDSSIDYFGEAAGSPKWLILTVAVLLVVGFAAVTLYFTGALDQILPLIFP